MKIENIFQNFKKGNLILGYEESSKEEVAERLDREISEVTDEDVWDLASEDYDWELDYLKNVLVDQNQYLMIASLGLWDGRRNAFKISENLLDAFGENDETQVFNYKGNVVVVNSHHDGTNYILVRKIKDNLSDLQLENLEKNLNNWIFNSKEDIDINKIIAYYSEKIPEIKEAF